MIKRWYPLLYQCIIQCFMVYTSLRCSFMIKQAFSLGTTATDPRGKYSFITIRAHAFMIDEEHGVRRWNQGIFFACRTHEFFFAYSPSKKMLHSTYIVSVVLFPVCRVRLRVTLERLCNFISVLYNVYLEKNSRESSASHWHFSALS